MMLRIRLRKRTWFVLILLLLLALGPYFVIRLQASANRIHWRENLKARYSMLDSQLSDHRPVVTTIRLIGYKDDDDRTDKM